MDHKALVALIRKKLADGRLTHDGIPRVWGSRGSHGKCVVCEEEITPDSVRDGRNQRRAHGRSVPRPVLLPLGYGAEAPRPLGRAGRGSKSPGPAVAMQHVVAVPANGIVRADIARAHGADHPRTLGVLNTTVLPKYDGLADLDGHATDGAAGEFTHSGSPRFLCAGCVPRKAEAQARSAYAQLLSMSTAVPVPSGSGQSLCTTSSPTRVVASPACSGRRHRIQRATGHSACST